jgi:hypothetical protein
MFTVRYEMNVNCAVRDECSNVVHVILSAHKVKKKQFFFREKKFQISCQS